MLPEREEGYSARGRRITLRLPDDFHHHCRDGDQIQAVLEHASRRFGRCLMMPNLQPPVTTTAMTLDYKTRILHSLPTDLSHFFTPLMVLYLTDGTSPDEIRKAAQAGLVGCKYYPAGATTNSEYGVTNLKHCYEALREMEVLGMMLCIHSEVTHGDIFEREIIFLDEVMKPLVTDFPALKITMEHISTKNAVDYVMSCSDNVKASITCHHLLYNRNHMLVGGIRPHLYCLPILKREEHRRALLEAATSGNPKFFLGTDSAPHATFRKEASCGCAGVFTAHAAIELYAEAFDRVDALSKLEDFSSSFGADHYALPHNTCAITLEKKEWIVPHEIDFGNGSTVTPLRAGEVVQWTVVGVSPIEPASTDT